MAVLEWGTGGKQGCSRFPKERQNGKKQTNRIGIKSAPAHTLAAVKTCDAFEERNRAIMQKVCGFYFIPVSSICSKMRNVCATGLQLESPLRNNGGEPG